jgi:hypothetical protein
MEINNFHAVDNRILWGACQGVASMPGPEKAPGLGFHKNA